MEAVYRLIYTDEFNKTFILEEKYYPSNSETLKMALREYYLVECIAEAMNFKLLVQEDFGELREIKIKGR